MRKTNLFAAALAIVLLFGAFAPQAEAQNWRRAWRQGYYDYAPTYYYSTPAYGYYDYGWTSPSYYSAPTYYYDYGYRYPSTSYYSGPTYWRRSYYGGYYNYTPYYRGYVTTPWVNVGW